MAPYSPAIGLPLGHESQAPLWPKPPGTKSHLKLKPKPKPSPLSLLGSNHIPPSPPTLVEPLAPWPSPFVLKPRKLIYTPHLPHARPRSYASADNANDSDHGVGVLRRSLPGLSTALFSVFLIMLIGLSSTTLSHERQGRQQSLVDMVRETYFDQGVTDPLQGYQYEQKRSVYLVKELEMMDDTEGETSMTIGMGMGMGLGVGYNFDKRDGAMSPSTTTTSTSTSASAIAGPSAAASTPVPILVDATTTSSTAVPTSSTRMAAPSATKSEFREADDVRDPTAVKPDDGKESMAAVDSDSDAQNATPARKRHWSSRDRTTKNRKRSF